MVESKKRKRIVVFALVVLAIVAALLVFLNTGAKTETPSQTTDTVLMVSPVAFDYNEDNGINVIAVEDTKKPHTPDLECIEQNGGGSARCMIAEIF